MIWQQILRPTTLTLAFVAGSIQASTASAQQVGRAPVDIRLLSAPSGLFALGRVQLVYEVRLTNFGAKPVTLAQLDALDPTGGVLGSWRDTQLAVRFSKIGAPPPAAPQNLLEVLKLDAGQTGIVYLLVQLTAGANKPASLHHRLITSNGVRSDTTLSAAMPVIAGSPGSLQSPVTDGPWVAIRGPSNSSGHRLSYVALGGQLSIPQRYAVDWARLGPDGRLFKADSTKLENWYGYGSPVTSVGDGLVVWTRADVAERAPFAYAAPEVIEAADAVGNAVIVDLGGGAFATFAHLKPGSVRVKVGDRVRTGQPIGEVGNSGNSLAPHLHFHVSDAPGPLAGDGLPFVIPNFELIGRVQSSAMLLGGGAWTQNPAQPARPVAGETPLENMVVRFRK